MRVLTVPCGNERFERSAGQIGHVPVRSVRKVVPRPRLPRGCRVHAVDTDPVVRELRPRRRSVLPRQRRVVSSPRNDVPHGKLAENDVVRPVDRVPVRLHRRTVRHPMGPHHGRRHLDRPADHGQRRGGHARHGPHRRRARRGPDVLHCAALR